jgi:glycerol-3-phosphate dehydrogenase
MYDIAIIGGGINGSGIARDAAGRGFKVYLAEMNDLASGTSSWSTKLIHGGLRYLEHYEFRLVREALAEREVLLRLAPHLIAPLRFVLPHHRGLRPAWLLRLGLFLYDHIGGRRTLPGTRLVDLPRASVGQVLKAEFTRAFEYSDCFVDDARLVVLNARDAADRGAAIATRTKLVGARRQDDHWLLTLRSDDGATHEERARFLVNAAGPWADAVHRNAIDTNTRRRTRLVRGSHIIVPRIGSHPEALILQNSDGRIVFIIPYLDRYSLIGTTDEDFEGDPATVAISDAEIDYLCRLASDYLRVPIRSESVVWTYSGVRALYEDGASKAQEATRDYVLDEDRERQGITVIGGKITTYRRLAEDVVTMIEGTLGARQRGPWTGRAALPGGDFPSGDRAAQADGLARAYPFLARSTVDRLLGSYGTIAVDVLHGSTRQDDLGKMITGDLSEQELRYLIDKEWARTAEDVLWRRSKLGLITSAAEVAALDRWIADYRQSTSSPTAEATARGRG